MMVDRPPTGAPTNTPGSDLAPNEERLLQVLQLLATVAIGVLWALESHQGVISPWDQAFYPVLMTVYAGGLWVQMRYPPWRSASRMFTVGISNLYLVVTLHLSVGPQSIDLYQWISTILWMPVGYSLAFIFLLPRQAIGLSLAVYCSTFAPLAWQWWHERGDTLGQVPWLLVVNIGIGHLIFAVSLLAITRLRSQYRQATVQIDRIQQEAGTDALTQLLNRRAIDTLLQAGASLAQRGTTPMSLVLLDIDHFKAINDQFGHTIGDHVLVELAQLLKAQVRPSDHVARWGGEEFLIIAQSTALDAALGLAERTRHQVQDHHFSHGHPVTISLGVVTFTPGETVDQALARADKGLYRAKHGGRNQVCTGPEFSPTVSPAAQ